MSDAVVYVVDDEPSLRDSVAMLLRSIGLPAKTFASAEEFLGGYSPGAPGCLIVDVRMPGMSGLELQEHLSAKRVNLPVIIMTGHGDVAMAVRAMKAGAADFLEKPFNDQVFIDSVQRALRQPTVKSLGDDDLAAIRARMDELTAREREVMQLLIEGRANKVIAAKLGLSIRTVETHRAKVMEKTDARSLAELVRMAIACGIMTG
jgi:two-component system, LuxR family, response regulator FixJ